MSRFTVLPETLSSRTALGPMLDSVAARWAAHSADVGLVGHRDPRARSAAVAFGEACRRALTAVAVLGASLDGMLEAAGNEYRSTDAGVVSRPSR